MMDINDINILKDDLRKMLDCTHHYGAVKIDNFRNYRGDGIDE